MMKSKKELIKVLTALTVSVLVTALVLAPNTKRQRDKIIQPDGMAVFMYFVSDGEYDKGLKKTVTYLEKKYKNAVIFSIKNVDEDKALLENYPVKDNTPALIMLDKNGDIDSILFKTADKEKLEEAIIAALAENEEGE